MGSEVFQMNNNAASYPMGANSLSNIFCLNKKRWEMPRRACIEINKDFIIYNKKIEGKLEVISKNHTLNPSALRCQFEQFDFNNFYNSVGGRTSRNLVLENRMIPPFSYVYYLFYALNLRVPSPSEFVCWYMSLFCEQVDHLTYSLKDKYLNSEKFKFNYNEIAARLCRAYNSFNREIELLARLFEEEDIYAHYSFERDYFDGIDLSIEYQQKYFGIASYQNSKNAEVFRCLKESLRHDYSNFNILSIAINPTNSIRIKDIMLYSDNAYKELIQSIKGF